MSFKRTIDKAIGVCDESVKYNKNTMLIELRERLREEYDAINNYLSMLPHIDSHKIAAIIKDIADEEKVHIGELEAILYELDPSEKEKVKEGMNENG